MLMGAHAESPMASVSHLRARETTSGAVAHLVNHLTDSRVMFTSVLLCAWVNEWPLGYPEGDGKCFVSAVQLPFVRHRQICICIYV